MGVKWKFWKRKDAGKGRVDEGGDFFHKGTQRECGYCAAKGGGGDSWIWLHVLPIMCGRQDMIRIKTRLPVQSELE
ncbi:hypothetical protein CEXT_517591 [Caerostris extrusa]|uniref:Uncharacterized protein n=1 Tax=Caerostris extrusa TaxID=172846 RepID=A0AAV4NWJ3_CAEEX|nr:hypothetical protein CEXT_517591 [Caerostris extrusa]